MTSAALRTRPAVRMAAAVTTIGLLAAACTDGSDTTGSSTATGGWAVTGSAPTCVEGPPPGVHAEADRIRAVVAEARDAIGAEAVLVRVLRSGRPVATFALGESMTEVPATVDMRFRNGAVAIAYLATVLLGLVEDGEVALEDTIDQWLPDLRDADRITLEMLIASTSGYPDHVHDEGFLDAFFADPFRAFSTEELIEFGLSLPSWYEPGTNWSYSHTGFVVLGLALEAATGRAMEDLIGQYVTNPAGLDATESFDTADIPGPVLHSFTDERGVREDATFWNPSWTLARGAVMVTDICDMAASARAIGNGELLSERSASAMIAPTVVGNSAQTEDCPVCHEWTEQTFFGLGVVVANGWVIQTPLFAGLGSVHSHLPATDLTIAIAATVGPDADPSVNPGQAIWGVLAPELAPDHPPR